MVAVSTELNGVGFEDVGESAELPHPSRVRLTAKIAASDKRTPTP